MSECAWQHSHVWLRCHSNPLLPRQFLPFEPISQFNQPFDDEPFRQLAGGG